MMMGRFPILTQIYKSPVLCLLPDYARFTGEEDMGLFGKFFGARRHASDLSPEVVKIFEPEFPISTCLGGFRSPFPMKTS